MAPEPAPAQEFFLNFRVIVILMVILLAIVVSTVVYFLSSLGKREED
jgi:uncharacterized protein YpmB